MAEDGNDTAKAKFEKVVQLLAKKNSKRV